MRRDKHNKVAIGQLAQYKSTTDGAITDDRAKFNALLSASWLDAEFTNNNITSIGAIERIELLESKVSSLVGLLNSTFTGSGTIGTDGYSGHTHVYSDLSGLPTLFDGAYTSLTNIPTEFMPTNHTHDYEDGAINDTADGTGTQTDTTRTSGGVN